MRPFALTVVAPLLVWAVGDRATAREPTRWALLIGVDDYAEVNDLRYAGNDQRALAEQLKLVGFPADQVFHWQLVASVWIAGRRPSLSSARRLATPCRMTWPGR